MCDYKSCILNTRVNLYQFGGLDMEINLLFFEDFETLDIFGPIEILSRIDNANLHYVSIEGGQIKSRQGYSIQTTSIDNIKPNGVFVIPGGQGTRTLINDQYFITQIRDIADNAEYVLSICTGSALLARTGLLDNRNATSNKNSFEWVTSVSDKVNWIRKSRWIVDGKFYTSSGVSAGMDMALGFVSDVFGTKTAEQIASDIEYIWNRDKQLDYFA